MDSFTRKLKKVSLMMLAVLAVAITLPALFGASFLPVASESGPPVSAIAARTGEADEERRLANNVKILPAQQVAEPLPVQSVSTESILPNSTPAARPMPPADGWALANLLLAIFTVVVGGVALCLALTKRGSLPFGMLSLLVGVVSIAAFLVGGYDNVMVAVDSWTLLYLVAALAGGVLAVIAIRRRGAVRED